MLMGNSFSPPYVPKEAQRRILRLLKPHKGLNTAQMA